jgi:hypothetical protein
MLIATTEKFPVDFILYPRILTMNSNLEKYLTTIERNLKYGLEQGEISMLESLPCSIFRELEVPNNEFVVSSDPFISSYRALSKIQHIVKPTIPRKIQFESAAYLKEGIIDFIFPNLPVTLIFIGDGNSDKRFSYNCHRLFKTFGDRFNNFCYICNENNVGEYFDNKEVTLGWNKSAVGEDIFFHAKDWQSLDVFNQLIIKQQKAGRQVLVLIDFDGTYLCPRPQQNYKIKDARKEALVQFCKKQFDADLFDGSPEQVDKLHKSYTLAGSTAFSINYDDEDLTILIALSLYFNIIEPNDPLLVGQNNIGFNMPIEFLTFAIFLIDNHQTWEFKLRQLKSLYVRCSDSINNGSPTAFVEFRRFEEQILSTWAKNGDVTLNKDIAKFILNCVQSSAVPIGYSDRPNASVGMLTNSDAGCTSSPIDGSLLSIPIKLI